MAREDSSLVERIKKDSIEDARDHKTRVILVVLTVVFVVSLVGTIIAGVMAYNDVRDEQKASTANAQSAEKVARANQRAAKENKFAARELAKQVERLGGNPVVDPSKLSGATGPAGPAGPPGQPGPPGAGVSETQVANAVSSYCSSGRCDGRSVTPSQVALAVVTYCNARGQCRGPEGSDGLDGTDGSDGNQGPPGPAPSDAQVMNSVQAYCANDRCVGPQGEPGLSGILNVETVGCDSLLLKNDARLEYEASSQTLRLVCA